MINEYLFQSNEYREILDSYKPYGVEINISNTDKNSDWIVSCFIKGENKTSAGKLSDVHISITQYFPIVLTCESSAYYNCTLFPLINKLERKLRKLLYLATSISDNEEAKKNIKQLEEKDFGTLFDLLFIDRDFITNLKSRINADNKGEFNGKGKYCKTEIQDYLNSLEEKTLWDKTLGEKYVPTLKERFRDVQVYRNDVMHAHNIDKKQFEEAQNLIKMINDELDAAIEDQLKNSDNNMIAQKVNINSLMSTALRDMDISSMTNEVSSLYENASFQKTFSALADSIQKLEPYASQMSVISEKFKDFSSYDSDIMQKFSSILPENFPKNDNNDHDQDNIADDTESDVNE